MDRQSYNRDNYRRLLLIAIENGYAFKTYQAVPENTHRREIVVRHDVDLCPFMALEMARIEQLLSVKVTYAFLTDSFFYNVLAPDIAEMIDEIHTLGHEIILHYRVPSDFGAPDLKVVKRTQEDIKKHYRILKAIYPYVKEVFVWHNPVSDVDRSRYVDFKVEGMINASNYREYTYISDSNMRYSYEELTGFVDGCITKLHLVLHPVYWMSEVGTVVGSLKAAMRDLITRQFSDLKNRTWMKEYRQRVGDKPVSLRGLLEFLDDQYQMK